MNKAQARKLVDQARQGLISAEQAIGKIIEAKAWIALGHQTFTALWKAEFSDIRLASEAMRAAVVYAMFDDGTDDLDVALGMPGVGPTQVGGYREDYDAGVPADLARPVRVRPFNRRLPSGVRSIRVEVPGDDYQHWYELATRSGSTVRDEAARAIREHFEHLEVSEHV